MPAKSKLGGRREGAGRKRTIGGRESKPMGLFLSDDLKQDLDDAAGKLGISRSDLIRRLARKGLTEKQQIATIRAELKKEASNGSKDE